MTKKHKHRHTSTISPADLRPRIERARQEGRFQQALELTKQLHKHEPTPANLELLKEVYLGRARQLRSQGQTRDAVTVLDVAAHLEGGTPAWLERLAQEMALCGEVGRTLALIDNLPDPAGGQHILAYVADAAVQQETAGRAALPPALQADFDRIILAFQQLESGQDEAARETLQGVGLRSPLLEWKLLLRGMMAYWQNDDERAVENWQRLTPERMPARLAAPFRFRIDTAFRAAQPPATQALLQKQIDRLQGSTLLPSLRTLQAALARSHAERGNQRGMAAALRQAEALLPALRQEAPQVVPRLAACFYWHILETGPDDLLRYQRVFGQPPDDPHFHRLQAIGYEKAEELRLAHRHWQQYEQEIAAGPEKWPGDQANHARAFIWQRMGQNAAGIPEPRRNQHRRSFSLFDDEEDLAPLNPPAEKCFQKSLELAPDLLETHEALVRYHLEAKRAGKAEKAARQLLQHFPDHVPTLELLSDLRRKHGDYPAALELIEQALKGNALDRRLRRKVSDAHLLLARAHVESGRFEDARQQFQSALDLSGGSDGGMILAHWAACEFKAGDVSRAEELIRQALDRTAASVGIAYLLLTEVLRLKLDRALKKRFEQDLKTGLAAPNQEAAVFLTRILAGLHSGGVKYIGQKGHTQKVLSYIYKTRNLEFSEPQLEELCRNLLDMEAYTQARRFANIGEQHYPESPTFPYLHSLAWIREKGRHAPVWEVVPMLKRARELAQSQPPNERRDRMLEDIDKHLHELNPFDLDFLGRIFGFGEEDDDDDDSDDDW
ncbi:MAG TPA: tetratricopeptide repeat protein [Gemmataceae bacterium]|nr:tetratricopeptide repeat protein [Gemmataceae bacterium]